MIKLAIHHHIPGEEIQFVQLIKLATGQDVEIVPVDSRKIDIAFCGPYHGGVGDYKNTWTRKVIRGAVSKSGPGRHLLIEGLAGGIQPLKNARINIWYTGENERPPFGAWDAYFSFEVDQLGAKNVYWPMAWSATNLLFPDSKATPWNSRILDVEQSIKPRELSKSKKKKFACAFIGKAYPYRLQILKMVSELGQIDIYGQASRRPVKSKFEIARNYKFMICPENDLYPGYVTEKPIEAYTCQTIPIYSGIDSGKILNPKAIINYANFLSKDDFLSQIANCLNLDTYQEVFTQPLFLRKPSLKLAIEKIRELLH